MRTCISVQLVIYIKLYRVRNDANIVCERMVTDKKMHSPLWNIRKE